jgi:hypothetical protein
MSRPNTIQLPHVVQQKRAVGEKAMVPEEGLATSSAHSYIRDRLKTDHTRSGDARYDAARFRVEQLRAAHPDAIRILREREPVISRISSVQIREVYPDVSRPEADDRTRISCDWQVSQGSTGGN